jgi:hypothetical protein
MLIDNKEMFLAFEHFPWFQDASLKKILHVEMSSESHLYWPKLDIDLDVNSILYPENYPLVSQHRIEQQNTTVKISNKMAARSRSDKPAQLVRPHHVRLLGESYGTKRRI